MAANLKYDACFNRLDSQIKRMANYMSLTDLCATDDERIINFACESVIVRIVAFFDEFIESIISLAACHHVDRVLLYLLRRSRKIEVFLLRSKDLEQLNWRKFLDSVKSEIKYENDAERLKGIFYCIFRFEFFPDKETECLILDAREVRNIIVHKGSWPDESDYLRMKNKDIVVVKNEVELQEKSYKFYGIEFIKNNFLARYFNALYVVRSHIYNHIQLDSEL